MVSWFHKYSPNRTCCPVNPRLLAVCSACLGLVKDDIELNCSIMLRHYSSTYTTKSRSQVFTLLTIGALLWLLGKREAVVASVDRTHLLSLFCVLCVLVLVLKLYAELLLLCGALKVG